ncbi:hypothetical protein NA57DRAFT_37617 [Rhizodiscina lignyota]|uniref:Actin binding protein n=1 Tax=Rhizodiscina lignyota TaxID=1504668 RepID=A0A9P4IG80_9PEZI|nr:hypothetical protein NA57DRAFT_37617 [Rhizodiscina lignyota]
MATLNLSTNGPSITNSYQKIVNSPPPSGPQTSSATYGQWAVYSVQAPLVSAFQNDSGKESVLKVQTTGEGELADLVEEFSDGRIQFGFVKVKDPNTTLPKCVLVAWCGQGVPERTKGYFTSHLAAVSRLLHGYHVQVTARSDADLTPENIVQKVADSSGSKYSGGGSVPSAPAGGPPPVASKPVFQPTRVGGGAGGFNPLGARSRAPGQSQPTDADGWGADAPPVTRSQLEKVTPAYQPTKVNINELTSKPQEPSRFNAPSAPSNGNPDVVRGAYQPIGKVDIAAIRRQAKESGQLQDERPSTVKGAYEPVGKVDIAAIKARAAGPSGQSPSSGLSPSATGASRDDDQPPPPPSLADRSAAFQQSERLTSLPKPKVANKFGGSSTFTGTKAPTPAGFGSKPVAAAAPVGTASKTFADEGGKTPAQIWAEKKARQAGGGSVTSPGFGGPASPIAAQTSGEGGWKSTYTGKSWAPVQTTRTGQSAASAGSQPHEEPQAEEPSSPAGAVSSIRDRFAGAAPMGAPASRPVPEPAEPPPMDMSSKPNAGTRGVPIPGLPTRPREEDVPEEQHVNVPPPPAMVPREPEEEEEEIDVRPSSPIRIVQPVARSAEPEIEPVNEPAQAMPTQSIAAAAGAARAIPPEPHVEEEDPARGAGQAAAETSFGAGAAAADHGAEGGPRALVQYDYEKAEDNEIELREGAFVTNIDMVDDDWWMGTNEHGDRGLFPSNYVEVVEADAHGGEHAPAPAAPAPAPAPAAPAASEVKSGHTAVAQYDYEAAEDNELSFPDGATITDVEFPDDDWWFGHYGGKTGLFPANYVQLNE